MPRVPQQFKDEADYDVGELVEKQAAAARGEDYRVETAEYKRYRNRVLEAGGLEPDRADDPPAVEDMTAAEHFDAQRRP